MSTEIVVHGIRVFDLSKQIVDGRDKFGCADAGSQLPRNAGRQPPNAWSARG
jgi:hypothetical protein